MLRSGFASHNFEHTKITDGFSGVFFGDTLDLKSPGIGLSLGFTIKHPDKIKPLASLKICGNIRKDLKGKHHGSEHVMFPALKGEDWGKC